MDVLFRPDGPSPGIKKQTSPSVFEEMRLCFLRCAFGQDVNFSKHQIPNPASVLGIASHKLYEELWHGTFREPDDVRTRLEDMWEAEVMTGYARMKEAASGDVPEPKTWPYYQMKRMSTILDIVRIVKEHEPGQGIGVMTTQAEAGLVGHGGLIAGRVDVIHQNEGGTEILDYKTGRIFDSEGSSTGETTLKPAFERQLLIYSDLYHEMHGEWPTRATVSSLNEGSYSITPDPIEANKVTAEAIGLLEAYNAQVDAGWIKASPSEEACMYCRFKALCPAYLERSEVIWKSTGITIRGKTTEVDAGGYWIRLIDVSGNTGRTEAMVIQVPSTILESIEVDETLSFSALSGGEGKETLVFRWWTQLWKWPPSLG